MKIGTYMKLRAVQKNDRLTDVQKSASLIAVMTGRPAPDLRKIPMGEFERMAKKVTAELDAVGKINIDDIEIKDEYTIDGIECRLMRTVNSMTAIQFSDLITVIKDDIDNNLHTILSILLVPKGKRYPDYDRFALEEKIVEHFELADGMAIANFCRGLSLISHQNILTSLVLNKSTAWTVVPKWRRALARKMISILLTPSQKLLRKNGVS